MQRHVGIERHAKGGLVENAGPDPPTGGNRFAEQLRRDWRNSWQRLIGVAM